MSLREEANKLVLDLADWYDMMLEHIVGMMEDKGVEQTIRIFEEEVPVEEEPE